ncbi:MAG: YfhO family protein [Flavobacteriales bacterium]|nr:YfhO family protein [Flavobacteriales bacterium]
MLAIVSAIGFSQTTFFLNPTKWDMINCFLPWRYFIGESLQFGNLPLWNPHVNLGNPIYADPSSGAWYPFVWIIGYFKGYSVYALSFELWLHVFLGGIGFYKLSKTMGLYSAFAILAAISYMFSGFYVGNAQHLPYVISACWLPFIIHFYLKLIQGGDWTCVVKGALAMFMLITGGYPAFTIILFYLLLTFFLVRLYQLIVSKEPVISFLLKNLAFLVATIAVSFVMILSIYQVFPFLTRLSTFNLQSALFSPFSPQCFISFILPYATTIRDFSLFDSDLAMRNAYFGALIFFFFIAGVFKKSSSNHRVFFYFGLFCLTASVGSYLPIREFLFEYVPMMSLFRFPSVFRLFVIISGIISGVLFLQSYFTENSISKKRMLYSISVVILALVVVIHIALNKEAFNLAEYVRENIFNTSPAADFWKHIAFQSILQLIIFVALFVLFWRVKNKTKLLFSIILLSIIDLTIATQLNAPSTVYSHKWTGSATSKKIEGFPKGFPALMDVTMQEAEDLPSVGNPFWANMSVFNKQITSNGYNSFIFSSYEGYLWTYPSLHTEILKNKIVQLSDEVLPVTLIDQYQKDSLFTNNSLFFDSEEYNKLSKLDLAHSENDQAKIIDYGPQYFKIETKTEHQQLLTLYQKNYTGWELTVNGENKELLTSNMNFMTLVLPAGENNVVFEYKNPTIKIAFWISTLTLLAMLISLVWAFHKSRPVKEI